MTTTTPTFAFPKPELTDLVTNGWDAIADLADAMDAQLAAVRAALQAADTAEGAARVAGDAASIGLAVIDAVGDLLVGTGPDAVARLPRGAAGYQLRVTDDGSGIAWLAPAVTDTSGLLPKAGGTMTGRLIVNGQAAVGQDYTTGPVEIQGDADGAARLVLHNPGTGAVQLRTVAADELQVYNAAGTAVAQLKAAAVFDNGNRVYSPSNPPPAGGAVITQVIRGTVAFGTADSTGTKTATVAVGTLAKAEIRHTGQSTNSGTDGAYWNVRVALTNATTVTAIRGAIGASGGNPVVGFEITEWS